jgi:hemerythrin-like domain-containing protein
MEIIDCRGQSPETQRQQLVTRCLQLEQGRRFVLHTSVDPRRWIDQLSGRYPGAYAWRPLEVAPGRWSGLVIRHAMMLPIIDGGVHQLMAEEHHHIRIIVGELAESAEREDRKQLGRLTTALDTELRPHFAVEESVLFPLIFERLPTQRTLLAQLQQEHAQSYDSVRSINRMLAEMGRLEATGALLLRAARALARLLREHSTMEDTFFYLAVDLLLSDEEREALTRQLR